jgi:hypothetical protein
MAVDRCGWLARTGHLGTILRGLVVTPIDLIFIRKRPEKVRGQVSGGVVPDSHALRAGWGRACMKRYGPGILALVVVGAPGFGAMSGLALAQVAIFVD